jgi:hypothetical protein
MKPMAVDEAAEPTEQAILLCRAYAMYVISRKRKTMTSTFAVCKSLNRRVSSLIEKGWSVITQWSSNITALLSRIENLLSMLASVPIVRAHPVLMGLLMRRLCVEWKSVLPLCTSCAAVGTIPLTRTRRRNGVANGQRAKRTRQSAPSNQAPAPFAPFTSSAHALPPAPIASAGL